MKRLVVLLLLVVSWPPLWAQEALDELVKAERAFSEYCGEYGMPEAWLEYFSADGLVFSPHPKNAHESNRSRVPSKKPAPFTLYWEPYHGTVSRAGDLGFNTGPWRITMNQTDTVPPQYGYFFSVWRKQVSGEWKVLLDLGASVPAAGAEHVFGAAYDERSKEILIGKSKAGSLEEAEYLFNGLAANGLKAAYQKMASGSVLSTVSGFHPFYNKRSLLSWLSSPASPFEKSSVLFSTADTGLASSGELGYSYGSYETKEDDAEKGYYVRVWRRNAEGKWFLIAEVIADNVKPRAEWQ